MSERARPPERPTARPRPTGPAPRPAAGPREAGAAEAGRPPAGVARPKGPVGRGIKAGGEEPVAATPPPVRPVGELSPFQKFGGSNNAAAATSSETVTVVGMVIALVMAAGAALAVVLIVILAVGTGTGIIDVPGVTPNKKHGQDTDVGVAGPRAQPKPGPAREKVAEVVPEDEGPKPAKEVSGTIVFDLKPGELFHTVEAKCPSTPNVRRRADIRGSRVSITLPDNEDCKLTFQGSLPAYAYLRGGQTKTCSFNPTNCR